MKKDHQILGMAAEGSPLREIFKGGIVPLRSIHARDAVLGDDPKPQPIYLIDLGACDPEEIHLIAEFITAKWPDTTMEKARAYLAESQYFPIREANISGVGFPARFVA